MTLRDQRGRRVTLGGLLGQGGEAEVYAVAGRSELVAKIYHRHAGGNADKLKAMVDHPPVDPTRRKGHVAICWPESMLFDSANQCVGFLMPLLDRAKHRELFHLYNPMDRRAQAPNFTWAYLLKTAENIAVVLESIHAKGYVVGDINESNFFVSDQALVTLVDCDFMQVRTPAAVFRCTVAKPEYLAPELQGKDLSAIDRGPEQDNFALAVLLFLLLMEGVHPYSGVWTGPGDPPPMEARIAQGDCPYAGSPHVTPMPASPPFNLLPASLRSMFAQAFGQGSHLSSARPSAQHWREALAKVALETCSRNKQHVYPQHLSACPWCQRTKLLGGFDPFPPAGSVPAQQPLKAKPFTTVAPPPAAARPVPPPPVASRPWLRNRYRAAPRSFRLLGALALLLPVAALSLCLSTFQSQAYPGRLAFFWAVCLTAAALGFLANMGRRRRARALLDLALLCGGLWLLGNRPGALAGGLQLPAILGLGAFCGSRSALLLLRPRLEQAWSRRRWLPISFASVLALLMPSAVGSVAAGWQSGAFAGVLSPLSGGLGQPLGQSLSRERHAGSATVLTCARPQRNCGCEPKGSFRPGDVVALRLESPSPVTASLTVALPGGAPESFTLPNRWHPDGGAAVCTTATLPIAKDARPGVATVRASLSGPNNATAETRFFITR